MFNFLWEFFRRRSVLDPRIPEAARTVHQFERPIRRFWISAWISAWLSIRGGMYLDEHLKSRLEEYKGRRPQNWYPLPFVVSIENGNVIERPNPDADNHPLRRLLDDPAGEDEGDDRDPREALLRYLRTARGAEGQDIMRDLREAEEEVEAINGDLQMLNARLEEIGEDRRKAVEQGKVAASTRPDRRGRPEVSSRWKQWVLSAAIGAFLVLEAWQLGLPYLNQTGVDIANLAAEWRRNPVSVLAGAGFAAAVSGSLFLLAHWVGNLLLSLYAEADPKRKTLLKVCFALVLAGMVIGATWAIADMRGGLATESGQFFSSVSHSETLVSASRGASNWAFGFLTLSVVLGVVYLSISIRNASERRKQELRVRQTWQHDEWKLVKARTQREELIRLERLERERLERRRDRSHRALRRIEDRVQNSERLLRETLEAERRYATAYVNSLVAALALDRYHFIRMARRKKKEYLIHGKNTEGLRAAGVPGNSRPRLRQD